MTPNTPSEDRLVDGEETLQGGVANAGAVVRSGDYVLRPSNQHSASIHAFLTRIRARGFHGASEPVSIDPDGRERLRFVPGDVPLPPYPSWAQTDEALASVAVLIRGLHDASIGLSLDRATFPHEVNYRRAMEPVAEELVMYGAPAEVHDLEWPWVAEQLVSAGAYWAVTPSSEHPHPRPVWGVWLHDVLYLSIGSPRLSADARDDVAITVHLGSVNDVVIVEGLATGQNSDARVLDAYNAKYDWNYTIDEYGPFTTVAPTKVMAWRSAGWAGREGFQQTGRWRFAAPAD